MALTSVSTARCVLQKKLLVNLLTVASLPTPYKNRYWTASEVRGVLISCGVDQRVNEANVHCALSWIALES